MSVITLAEPARVDFDVALGDGITGTVVGRALPPGPTAAASLPAPIWFYCQPGAGEDWTYWFAEIPGLPAGSYNAAQFFAERGAGVVAVNHLGSGDSVFSAHGEELTFDLLAQANGDAVAALRARLQDGTLIPGLAPVADPLIVGIGHSGGAGVTLVTQAVTRAFELVADLGIPVGPFGGYDEESLADLQSRITVDEQGYVQLPFTASDRYQWFMDDVPETISGDVVMTPFPPSLPTLMGVGVLEGYVKRIESPVFIGFGERDLVIDPLAEARYYTSSDDVTLYIQPRAAHCHNYASTRTELWTTLFNWAWSRARALRS